MSPLDVGSTLILWKPYQRTGRRLVLLSGTNSHQNPRQNPPHKMKVWIYAMGTQWIFQTIKVVVVSYKGKTIKGH